MLRSLLIPFALAFMIPAPRARACDIALVLAMDVSGSVDHHEYRLQAEGLAQALRDPEVITALMRGRVALAVVQWSGSGQQTVSIPWVRMEEEAAIRQLAARVTVMPRAFAGGNTAVGEAVSVAMAQFPQVRDCAHWVIDVSGDGDENEGFTIGTARRAAYRAGITINGLAIEGLGTGQSITNFYRNWVITPGGFVETAQTHLDFAGAMRRKLLRELVAPVAGLGHPAQSDG